MADAFSITTASGNIELDANRKGSASFSVTNVSGHAIRARADVVAEAVAAEAAVAEPVGAGPRERGPQPAPPPPPGAGWFAIAGNAERSFPIGGTEVYQVDVTVPAEAAPPPTAAPRRYRFRLDVLGTDNPDEDQAQGQWVEFTVRPQPAPARRIPWLWILVAAAAALVVVVGVIVTVVVLSHRQGTLTPNTSTLNFGTVAVATTGTQAVTVANTGSVPTTVKATVTGANASDFSVVSAACLGQNLDPNATCVFNVTFKPAARGSVVGSLQITGNHAATKTVALTGTGVAPVATASNVSLTQLGFFMWNYTVTITDTGDAPLHVTNATVSGLLAIQINACTGHTVAPNQQCQIAVVSTVLSGVAPSGTLSVVSDATGSPLNVALAP